MTETRPASADDLLLVNAYLDGELDAAAALEVERRLAEDARLRTYYEGIKELSHGIGAKLPRERTPEALRARIAGIEAKIAVAPDVAAIPRRPMGFRQLAAAMVLAAGVASAATVLALRPTQTESDIAGVMAGHRRALLAQAPYDIASSDRHTVKPWFDAKLALSPRVPDLAAAGFPLEGGRIDIVGGKAVPTIVYKRREHLVSLVAVPKPGAKDDDAPAARQTRDGHLVLSWRGDDFAYYAVSDVAAGELEAFAGAWRTEARGK